MKHFRSIAILFSFAVLAVTVQSAKVKGDFSSPKSVVETFIHAAKKQDKETLSRCFSEQSPGEWDSIRDQSISKGKLKELKRFVAKARITKVEMHGEDAATVHVKFTSRDEKIHTIKVPSGWSILDF